MNESEFAKQVVKNILNDVLPHLDEKQRRILMGSAASALEFGGVSFVAEITKSSRNTVAKGKKEIIQGNIESSEESNGKKRIRKPGGGRKKASYHYPDLPDRIEDLISEHTFGSPEKILKWTSWSLRTIAEELGNKYDIHVSHIVVSHELERLGYSKQLNQKMYQVGKIHPNRDDQFKFINTKSSEFLDENEPVISVDTKKKENLGNFKNNGQEYRKKGDPRPVLDHDFPIKELGKVVPYGVYVINNNTGFVNLGTSHDTPEFAGQSIMRWWDCVGKHTFPNAKRLYITCDNGGSNGSQKWLWKAELQKFANVTGLEIHVSHFPTGTSKWNKIEHRLFCFISRNWQGKPLIDMKTVVKLIGSTTTTTGLKVICKPDYFDYECGKKIAEEDKDKLNITYEGPNENWNYIIRPND